MNDTKFCTKCSRHRCTLNATGAGRQYRCAECSAGREAARPVGAVGGLTLLEVFARLLNATPGLTTRQISEQSGHPMMNTQREVCRLVQLGKLHAFKTSPHLRYFASVESLEASRPMVEADEALYRIDSRKRALAKNLRYYRKNIKPKLEAARALAPNKPRKVRKDAGIPKKLKAEKPPKVAKAPRPLKVMQPKPIPAKHSLDEFKKAIAAIPDHVKVQVIPGYTGDRWQVQAPRNGFASLGIGRYVA
jgi:hypothetical protein